MTDRAAQRCASPLRALLVGAALLTACTTEPDPPELLWPAGWEPLPACEAAWAGGDALPDTVPAWGLLFMHAEGLQPTGELLRMELSIRAIGGAPDLEFAGPVSLVASPSSAVEIVSVSLPSEGSVTVQYRVLSEGLVRLDATVDDGRTGSTELFGYASNLPIWGLDIAPSDLDALLTALPDDRARVPAALTLDGRTYEASTRLHGGSSIGFEKKSWRIDLEPDADGAVELPDGTDHLILRAEYADKTMLRNYLSFELLRSGTTVPASRIEPVHMRLNGEFYGLMMRAERVDGDWFRARGLFPDGQLYESDQPREFPPPGGNLTPLDSLEDYRTVYQHHRGAVEYDDLIALIEGVLHPAGSTRAAAVEDVIAIEDVIVYAAVQALIQNHDHLRKNFYLSRSPFDVTEERWRFIPWDLDLTWGHLWTEQGDILDEQLFVGQPLDLGTAQDRTAWDHNGMLYAVLSEPVYRSALDEAMLHLVDDVFTAEFVQGRIDNLMCRAMPELLADTRKRANNEEYAGRVDELLEFLDSKRAQVLEQAQ